MQAKIGGGRPLRGECDGPGPGTGRIGRLQRRGPGPGGRATGQHTSAYDEAPFARRALQLPAFLSYDRTLAARFEVKPRKWVTLVNQNLMLTGYPGDIGGKLGWTSAAGATYVGMARRHGVTLIVTLLHCPPLTEFKYAASLLNWGFAVNGKVRPVGTLVGPLPAPAPGRPAPRPHQTVALRPVASGSFPSGPVTIGVSFVVVSTLTVAGFVGYQRRRRRRALSR